MSSTTETGHAKNVANFQQLISFCIGYGPAYNPSRKEIVLTNLQNVLTQSQAVMADLKNTKAAFDLATNTRRNHFADLPKFSAQVVNALAASGVSPLSVADAKGILRKMQGKRAKEIKAVAPATGPAAPATADTQISVSQVSYDNLIEHFSKLVSAVLQQKEYNPNEAAFTVTALQAKLSELNTVNVAVMNSNTELSNARINRNNILYSPTTGLTDLAAGVKLYVKSIFGPASAEYRQVSGIKFNTLK